MIKPVTSAPGWAIKLWDTKVNNPFWKVVDGFYDFVDFLKWVFTGQYPI